MAITFDPASKRIVLDDSDVDAIEIYSRWKDWVRSADNAKWPQAFSVVGGDDLGSGLYVASYFFLTNGWRIRPREADQLLVIHGTIQVLGGGNPVVNTLGDYNVVVSMVVPVQAQAYDSGSGGGGSSGPSASEIADAVRVELSPEMAKLQALQIVLGRVLADIRAVNAIPVDGVGSELNPWGPA